MLKLSDLAARPDFDLGSISISPARRTVCGPSGEAHLEPLVMQVFLLLLDLRGSVVSRTELFDQVWGGVMVGDDSLNRVVARVRRIAAETSPGLFEIETIPRSGYRMTGAILDAATPTPRDPPKEGSPGLTRRYLAAGAIGVTALGGLGAWSLLRSKHDPRFEALMARGEDSLRKMVFGPELVATFEQAVRLEPRSARALGGLAVARAMAVEDAEPIDSSRAVRIAQDAASRAFSIDPKEPNALLAIFLLQGSTLDWPARDRSLRGIVEIDPKNIMAISELVALLQSSGLNRESWDWNERAIAIEPLSSVLLGRRALKLWIAGRVLEADKVVDQVRGLWPSDRWAWWVQFLILALSSRANAARAMLESDPAMLGGRGDPVFWPACLTALDERTPQTIARAKQACFDAARSAGIFAAHGVMMLAELGEVDAAFEVANGFLLWRGPIVRGSRSASKQVRSDASWRLSIQWLFTPPCAAMRADPRFLPLCDGIGLTDYWRSRGVKPDYQIAGSKSLIPAR